MAARPALLAHSMMRPFALDRGWAAKTFPPCDFGLFLGNFVLGLTTHLRVFNVAVKVAYALSTARFHDCVAL